jgi:tetratricopeptide (TPR) repeat protein
MPNCPWEAVLPSIGENQLDDLAFAAIEQHVSDCPYCKSALEDLAHRWHEPRPELRENGQPFRIPGYEIERELGRGAMGVVYLATQTALGRPVALKILRADAFGDARQRDRRRCLREARAVSSVRHPNVVTLYDWGEVDGRFFLVLEYVAGGSLKSQLAEPLRPAVAARLLEATARAVAHIHSRGLLHLDLKPSNILLDYDSESGWEQAAPRVADFGLAHSDDHDLTATAVAGPRGTPAYMAPEQADGTGLPVGVAADVYALGAVLFELLTGRPPFLGTSVLETLDRVRHHEPVAPTRLNPAIPRDLETICLKCLEKDPARRYASAADLANDLRRWRDGQPILAKAVSVPGRVWRWCVRFPTVAALAASLAITFCAAFVTIFMLWRYAEAERIRAEAARRGAEVAYETSRAALAGILDLGQRSLEPQVVVTRDQVVSSLKAARGRILELRDQRPQDRTVRASLADVDLFLGRNLEYLGRLGEGEVLFRESLANRDQTLKEADETFVRKAGNVRALNRWLQTLECLARVLEHQGNATESLTYWERAFVACEAILPLSDSPDVNTMAECRMGFARLLVQSGEYDRAIGLLKRNLAMFKTVPPAAVNASVIAWASRSWCALAQYHSESDGHGVEEWDRDAVTILRLNPIVEDRGLAGLAESGFLFQKAASDRASHWRRARKVDLARRIVGRMHRFAQLLVATCPAYPSAHLACSEALRQSAKEAFEPFDRGAVQRHWESALAEATKAQLLNPDDKRAKGEVAALRRRLDRLSDLQANADGDKR